MIHDGRTTTERTGERMNDKQKKTNVKHALPAFLKTSSNST